MGGVLRNRDQGWHRVQKVQKYLPHPLCLPFKHWVKWVDTFHSTTGMKTSIVCTSRGMDYGLWGRCHYRRSGKVLTNWQKRGRSDSYISLVPRIGGRDTEVVVGCVSDQVSLQVTYESFSHFPHKTKFIGCTGSYPLNEHFNTSKTCTLRSTWSFTPLVKL